MSSWNDIMKFFGLGPKIDKAKYEENIRGLATLVEVMQDTAPRIEGHMKSFDRQKFVRVYGFLFLMLALNVYAYQNPSAAGYVLLFASALFFPMSNFDISSTSNSDIVDIGQFQYGLHERMLSTAPQNPQDLQAAGFTDVQINAIKEILAKAEAVRGKFEELTDQWRKRYVSEYVFTAGALLMILSMIHALYGLYRIGASNVSSLWSSSPASVSVSGSKSRRTVA